MSLRQFIPTDSNVEAARSQPTYTSNVTTAHTHTDGTGSPNSMPGRDSGMLPIKTESSFTDTLGVAETSKVVTPRYSKRPYGKFKFSAHFCVNLLVYYRIYAEDGAIPLKTPLAPGDPFLGRIKARSVPPPHTVKAVKRSIANVENIKDRTNTSLFLTQYSQSPMGDACEVTILDRTGPGSTPHEPLALVAKMTDSEPERSALESGGGGELASVAEPNSTPLETRYRKSIQHFPTFLFHNISTVGGSVLSALRRRL